MGLDRAPIEFQTFYFSHVCVTPPTPHPLAELALGSTEKSAKKNGKVYRIWLKRDIFV